MFTNNTLPELMAQKRICENNTRQPFMHAATIFPFNVRNKFKYLKDR